MISKHTDFNRSDNALCLNPDYSCRSGICHTCMCTLVEGEIEYLEEPLDEPDPGCVLICCARPKTSVVIEV